MDGFRKGLSKRALLIAALIVSSLAGCVTSRNRAPTASARIALLPEVTPATTHQARSKHFTILASSSPVASTKQNTAMVLSQMHQTNLMEIALGKIAQDKASMSEVRAYAGQLVQDHTNFDQAVVAMAQKSGIQLQNGLVAHQKSRHGTAQEEQLEQRLKSASGPDFDRLFLQQTSADHESLIRKLQKDREDASDDELEALIDKMIPILEQHRELAQILMKKKQA
jgi:putative membrane protein